MSSGWRLDWRGSSGSLWSRGRDCDGPDGLDLLNGARHVPPSGSGGREGGRNRRKGLRKRFLSLTEGLASFLSGDKKEKESIKPANFRPFDHSTDLDVTNSGYCSDYSSDCRAEHRRKNSNSSLSSFKGVAPSVAFWTNPVNGRPAGHVVGSACSKSQGSVKAPPSPPPRRFSLWAMDVRYDHYYFPDPLRPAASVTYEPSIMPVKPLPPPPPIRYYNMAPPKSPLMSRHTSPRPQPPSPSVISLVAPKRPRTPPSPRSQSPFRSGTPPTPRVSTPMGSPVMRGRSLSDSRTDASRAGSEVRGRESRAEWYRRKSQARRRAQSPVQGSGCVVARTVGVVLEKEEGSFGFTVRGGSSHDATKSRPLIITHVRPGGPADREGTIKAGDRLVAVDGRDLTRCSLTEAQEALRRVERSATLTVEYDVSVMDGVRATGGPLLVEIERAVGTSLGITLTHAHPEPTAIVIETIRTASIAERCGALAVNDIVAAIDGTRLDQLTVAEAAQLLKTAPGSHVTLEIIPGAATQARMTFRRGGGVAFPHLYGVVGSSSGYGSGVGGYMSGGSSYNTLTSQRPRSAAARRVNRRTRPNDRTETGSVSSHTTGGGSVGRVGVCHPECLTVTLVVEGRGYGLVLRPPPHPADPDTALPVIAAIDPGGPADKCSVVCVGDRLMGVNGRSVSGLGVSEVTQMVANSRPTVTLDVEFDVADSVVPSSGTFAVKLAKRHNGLGITLTAGRRAGAGEPLLISEVVRGSPAHRSGTMQPGDRLLAIDDTRLENLTLEDARTILQCCDEIVTLRVQKDELYSEESGGLVMYTVELVRHGGALGITISGSEEPFDPIYIAGLAPGGLADRTGAIHIGDRLLAINGASLRGKPLSEAILMLQNSGDTVTLKISRPRDSGVPSEELPRDDWLGRFGPAIPSVDSAVESWDSSGLDPPPPGSTPALSKRDSGSDIVFRSDCGSTVRRRGGLECREETNGAGDADGVEGTRKVPEEDVRDTWGSPSPPPSIDSGQSEDKTDWDKMIADLNQISESCGLRDRPQSPPVLLPHGHAGTAMQRKKEGQIGGSEVPVTSSGGTDAARCQTLSARRRPAGGGTSMGVDGGDAKEEGSYSISNAALTYTATYARTASPPPGGGQVYQVTLLKDRVYEDFGFSVSDGLYEKGVYVNRIRKGGPADRSGVLKPFDRILQVNDTRTHDFDCCLTVPLMAAAGDRLVLVVSRNPHVNPTLDFSSDIHSPAWNDIDEGEEDEAVGEKELGDRDLEPYSSPTPSFTPIPTILKTL
ncbi:glutamate receptor-interacting protein 2-like isoform X2 [Homarus americanus]|uniref:glutamate receptor-interacting protein 2-like isoform X2 n=1 Tax=Homarus americanus TaxID=6706 RepID=UPI001C48F202|nr:glutamate receptor-interacting protein 2-like isoform X2 [Homarus americanus]